jgi:hypothetical protein
MIFDASALGTGIKTFTAHRSPLGLVFDIRHHMAAPYTGDGFVLSYSKGLDSSESFFPNNMGGPFLDPSEDLLHLKLEKDESIDNYRVYATRIVGGFHGPVDAEILGNKIFVIENQWPGPSSNPWFYEIIFPAAQSRSDLPIIFPNPGNGNNHIRYEPQSRQISVSFFAVTQQLVAEMLIEVMPGTRQDIPIDVQHLSAGTYFCLVTDKGQHYRLIFQKVE